MNQIPVSEITVEHNPTQTRLDTLNVSKWPTWKKEISTFPWTFPEQEIAYIIDGECIVTTCCGTTASFGKGDIVTFPAGINITWEVKQPLYKHYQLDGSFIGRIYRRIKIALKL
jgi:uncharacterized cupin superfamily protein